MTAIAGAITLSLHASLRAQEPDPRPIVEQASRVYQQLTSFRSDFRQVISDPMIGTFESRGRLTQAGEARLAMRFTDPAGEAIVMDGGKLWVYTPSTTPGQVLRLKLPTDPVYGPNVLAWILTRPTERYRSRYVRADAIGGRAVDIVALVPIDQSLPFTEAVVWLDQYDHLPRRLEIRERGGQRRTLTLSGVEINRRVVDATFRFEVPAGVRIVDQ
jgi:outer membrane lipoprotein carrier protein